MICVSSAAQHIDMRCDDFYDNTSHAVNHTCVHLLHITILSFGTPIIRLILSLYTSSHHVVGVDSEELMGRAIDLIVLCAQMNEHFSFMYAELCRKITDKWSSGTADEVSV